MPNQKPKAKIDPELTRQMSEVAADESPVEAVVMLRQTPAQIASGAARTERTVRKVLERVQKRVGSDAKAVNVFKNLGSFVVAAAPGFLRELMTQPEVASAVANRQPDEASLPPEKKRPAPRSHPRKSAASKRAKSAKAR